MLPRLQNTSWDKAYVFVSEVSPTLCLHSRFKFEEWKDFYEVTTRCLKTATKKIFSLFDLNAKGIVVAKNNDLKMEQCLKSYHST